MPPVRLFVKNTRRDFLAQGAALLSAPLFRLPFLGAVEKKPHFSRNPFTLGVASGDPLPDGFVIWTRLAPEPLSGGGAPPVNIEVEWEIAHDESMKQVVRRGTTVASPDLGHSVHVELAGLEPSRWYFYRFRAGDYASAIGRTRTAPRPDESVSQLKMAFVSCQHYETGYYTGFRHMAEENLDLVIHLGDYIYESAGADGRLRKHTGGEIETLVDYRNRYALYRSDPDLQLAHASCPWLVTWDDHELDNNYAAEISQDENVAVDKFLDRRAAAYQAYYEHMPLRKSSIPRGPFMQLYRKVTFGDLAEFFVLDTRQYRSDQPCGDGIKSRCTGAFDPDATILGGDQEAWLFDGLVKSSARWNVLAQQVMMAHVDRTPGPEKKFSMDKWSAYEVSRSRLLYHMLSRKVSNPVVLTGDIHSNWVCDLKADFGDEASPTIASEFVGTSISSGGDGSQRLGNTAEVLAENPFVRYFNAQRGYVRCVITPDEWQSDYRIVEHVTIPNGRIFTDCAYVIENGKAGVERASL